MMSFCCFLNAQRVHLWSKWCPRHWWVSPEALIYTLLNDMIFVECCHRLKGWTSIYTSSYLLDYSLSLMLKKVQGSMGYVGYIDNEMGSERHGPEAGIAMNVGICSRGIWFQIVVRNRNCGRINIVVAVVTASASHCNCAVFSNHGKIRNTTPHRAASSRNRH